MHFESKICFTVFTNITDALLYNKSYIYIYIYILVDIYLVYYLF